MKRPSRNETLRPRPAAARPDTSRTDEDRSTYRRAPTQQPDKKADVGAGTADLEFVSLVKFSVFSEVSGI